jgi:peptidyl serine alpha-galactosyltransferase
LSTLYTNMALRTRKTDQPRNEERIRALKRGRKKELDSNANEPISASTATIVFLLLCLVGGYLDYYRRADKSRHLNVTNNSLRNGASAKGTADKTKPHEVVAVLHSMLKPEEDLALETYSDNTRYQLIFSTDCSPYQDWQSYLVFFTAMRVKQPGHVTRIASGCSIDEEKAMKQWFNTHIQGLSSRFHLHLTPYFSGVKSDSGETVGDYKFFNKPFGLKHWMENAENFSVDQADDVVILIDPDMALLRPITGDFSQQREVLIGPRRHGHELGTKVEHGLPFGQAYGLGTQWETFDLDKIAGEDSPAQKVDKENGFLYFPVGPPYLAKGSDMYAIALKWTEFVPRVHAQYPHLLAEMFAFCIAAAHLGLRHQVVDSLMISNTGAGGEGWDFIDMIPPMEMCEFAANPDHSKYALPSVVHICQRYAVGDEWFFGKRKVPHDIFACEKPLLAVPPADLATRYTWKRPPNSKNKVELGPKVINQEAFVVCFMHSLVNDAASFYKLNSCPAGGANLEKSLKMVDLFAHGHNHE